MTNEHPACTVPCVEEGSPSWAIHLGRKMKRLIPFVLAAGWVLIGSAASASPQITWVAGVGVGSDALPCADDAHWLLSEADGVQRAEILVGGSTYDMQQVDDTTLSADSKGPILLGDVVIVSYKGGHASPTLTLAGCVAPSPSPTTSPSPTDPPPTSSKPPPVSSRPIGGGGLGSGDAGGSSLRAAVDSSASSHDPSASQTGAGTRSPHERHGSSSSPQADRPSPADGTSGVPIDSDEGETLSRFRDPRTRPVALVIGVLIAVVVISSFGARRYFAHAGGRTA